MAVLTLLPFLLSARTPSSSSYSLLTIHYSLSFPVSHQPPHWLSFFHQSPVTSHQSLWRRVTCRTTMRCHSIRRHAPLLLDSPVHLPAPKPLGLCTYRILVCPRYDRFSPLGTSLPVRIPSQRCLFPLSSGFLLGSLFLLGPMRPLRHRHFHLLAAGFAALQSPGRLPHARQANAKSHHHHWLYPSRRTHRRTPPPGE